VSKDPTKPTIWSAIGEAIVVALIGAAAIKAAPVILLVLILGGLASCVM
jgi:hypothetical protein